MPQNLHKSLKNLVGPLAPNYYVHICTKAGTNKGSQNTGLSQFCCHRITFWYPKPATMSEFYLPSSQHVSLISARMSFFCRHLCLRRGGLIRIPYEFFVSAILATCPTHRGLLASTALSQKTTKTSKIIHLLHFPYVAITAGFTTIRKYELQTNA